MAAVTLPAMVFSSPKLGAVGPRLLEFISAAETAKIRRVSKRFLEMTTEVVDHQMANLTKIDHSQLVHYQKLLNKPFVDILNKMPRLIELSFRQINRLFLPYSPIDIEATVAGYRYASRLKKIDGEIEPQRFLALAKYCPLLEYFPFNMGNLIARHPLTDDVLLSILPAIPNLRTVGLYHNNDRQFFTAAGLEKFIQLCPKLEGIEIGTNNELHEPIIDAIATMGPRLKSFSITFYRNPTNLLEKLLIHCQELRHLNIDINGTIEPIIRRLRCFKKLETFRLRLIVHNLIHSTECIPMAWSCRNLKLISICHSTLWSDGDDGQWLIDFIKQWRPKVAVYSSAGFYIP